MFVGSFKNLIILVLYKSFYVYLNSFRKLKSNNKNNFGGM